MPVAQTIAVCSPSFCQSDTLVTELSNLGCKVIVNHHKLQTFDSNSLIKFLVDAKATIAIIGKEPINHEVLAATGLRAIAKYGVGVDNIDLAAVAKHQIAFGHTAGVNRKEVAEQVIGFAIGHFRRLFNANAEMHQGIWHKNGGRDLSDLKVGIIGLGHVGSAVAEMFKYFGAAVCYTDIVDKSGIAGRLGIETVSFNDIIGESDLITLHVPLTAETRGMISSLTLATMSKTALLINTARGEVVDFPAVIEAVQNGRIGGYAADVFTAEPPDLSSFLTQEVDNKNLYFTPHIAANSIGAVLKMGRSAISWVQTFIDQPPSS